MEEIELFDGSVIDRAKTIKNAEHFLTYDFPNYINMTGKKRTALSTPNLDVTGVHGSSAVNHQEASTIHDVEKISPYEHCVEVTLKAVDTCSNSPRKPYASILYWRYVRNYYNNNIYDTLGISPSQFYRLRKGALIEFAQRFESYSLNDVYCDKFPKILVYKVS